MIQSRIPDLFSSVPNLISHVNELNMESGLLPASSSIIYLIGMICGLTV